MVADFLRAQDKPVTIAVYIIENALAASGAESDR